MSKVAGSEGGSGSAGLERVVLPPLKQRRSPNFSSRHGVRPNLLVLHETAGSYAGAVSWLCNPRAEASAHLVIREDGLEATQLVRLREKAWHAAAYNGRSIGCELANVTPKGYATERQLHVAARAFAWLCLELEIPPRWARRGEGAGVCYHGELGALGGGHTACGPNASGWRLFLELLHAELAHGHFRKEWLR